MFEKRQCVSIVVFFVLKIRPKRLVFQMKWRIQYVWDITLHNHLIGFFMSENRYEEEFCRFLLHRLDTMVSDKQAPWTRATEEPIVNGFGKTFLGVDLLMLTHHCRMNGLTDRCFLTYQQRKDCGYPVRRNEESVLIEGSYRNIPVFPSKITGEKMKMAVLREKEFRKELFHKALQWSKNKGVPFNENGVSTALYRSVLKNRPGETKMDILVAEMAAAAMALRMGISKKMERENIRFLGEFRDIVPNLMWGDFLHAVKNEQIRLQKEVMKMNLEPEKYKENIESSLRKLNENKQEPKRMRLEDLLTPKIRI